ncbi:MAG: hypothetical protein KBC69_02905 [Candidatus Magasanikbacteria bacterium]|nr:hypothetical protein [Candidatus Magasanikbacteria bacterium]
MSEREYSPIQETQEITQRPEYAQACENTRYSGDLVRELLRLGVPAPEVKTFALGRLEINIKNGYGLNTLRSIAKQGGALSETEVETMFAEVTAKMLAETPAETEEQKATREARELEEMLSLYEK